MKTNEATGHKLLITDALWPTARQARQMAAQFLLEGGNSKHGHKSR